MIKLKDILFEGDMDVSSLNLHRTSVGFLDREKIIGYQWDNFQKNYLKLNPRYRIANANDRVYGYKLGDGDAHWMYDPNDSEIYLDDKMTARKVTTGRADKNIFEGTVNEATIKAIDITFTDRGRFYKVEVDGQRRVKGYDSLRSSEESLSSLLGYDISLRSMDDRVLDKAIKDLERKGIELSYNDAMDVS